MSAYQDRLGSISGCVTIDFLDMVAGNIAAGRLSLARDEEYKIEWAGFPVEHLELHGLVRECQSSGFIGKTVNVARIACFGVAHLVKFQWLILKAKFVFGWGRQEMTGVAINVASDGRVNEELVKRDAIAVTGNGNRVSVNSWRHKVPGILECRFVSGLGRPIANQPTSVVCQRCQQIRPMCDEWQESVSRYWEDRSNNADHVRGMRNEACKDAALRNSFDIKAAPFVTRISSVFVRDSSKGSSEIEQVKRLLVLDFDDHSCRRLAHILGPQRFSCDVNRSDQQFNGETEVAA